MKNFYTLLGTLFMFALFPSFVIASSGACSGHDGVNCQIGPDTDGSVICVDGWLDSSVFYYDIKEVCGAEYTELLFNDVAKYSPYYESIKAVKEAKIVSGYPDGFFRPTLNINRAEFTKILVGAMRSYFPDEYPSDTVLEAQVTSEKCFSDVEASDWYAKYVCFAKEKGFTDGYPDGSFGPEKYINVVEAMKIVFEARDYYGIDHSDDGVWYNKYTLYADENDLWVEAWNSEGPEYFITRGEMSEFIIKSVFRQ